METLRKGSKDPSDVTYLQVLLCDCGHDIAVDGAFGPETESAVKEYQVSHGLVADGIVGPMTWAKLAPTDPQSLRIDPTDMERAALDLGLDLPTIEAVCEVEASGSGFIGTKPKILFEGHIFWRQLKKRRLDPAQHQPGNRHILYESWTTQHYLRGILEYQRLYRAVRIHEEAALESASWGLFQILGSNYVLAGSESILEFVAAMNQSEAAHLRKFCSFLRTAEYRGKPLVHYLRERDWAAFARAYNGPAYAQNQYDVKLAEAYSRRTS